MDQPLGVADSPWPVVPPAAIEPGGGNAEIIVKNRGEIGGPLEQFSTVGYKFETGHIVLYPERLLRVMSVSAYSAVDESNY